MSDKRISNMQTDKDGSPPNLDEYLFHRSSIDEKLSGTENFINNIDYMESQRSRLKSEGYLDKEKERYNIILNNLIDDATSILKKKDISNADVDEHYAYYISFNNIIRGLERKGELDVSN